MSNASQSITGFLEARITEDESAAQGTSPSPWQWDGDAKEDEAFLYASNDEPVLSAYGMHSQGFLECSEADRKYIARHSPARDLAECAAKRAIVGAHPITNDVIEVSTRIKWGFACETCFSFGDVVEDHGYCDTLRALASVYANHLDYNEAWKL